jgi:hypothetical protein
MVNDDNYLEITTALGLFNTASWIAVYLLFSYVVPDRLLVLVFICFAMWWGCDSLLDALKSSWERQFELEDMANEPIYDPREDDVEQEFVHASDPTFYPYMWKSTINTYAPAECKVCAEKASAASQPSGGIDLEKKPSGGDQV